MSKNALSSFLLILASALVIQGCGGSSGSSDTVGPGGGDDGGWSTTTVKTGNFTNDYIRLALDSEDHIYISSCDFNEGLIYSTNKSGSWVSSLLVADDGNSQGGINDITVDNEGHVHVIFSSQDGIHYGTNESGSWQYEDLWLQGAGSCAIVADAGGNIHAAFDDNGMSDIRYNYKPAGGSWGSGTALADEWIASECDIALDGSGNPHIIFNFQGHNNLRYAELDNDWNVSTIEGSDTSPYTPDTGWSPRIAVNKVTGAANIVFFNYTDNTIEYSDANANNAVVLKNVGGWVWPCIDLDSSGNAYVFFREYITKDIYYSTNRSGTWVTTKLPLQASGLLMDVKIDSSDKIHLVYSSEPYGNLMHSSYQLPH